MAFRVEITHAAERDGNDILEWLKSQQAGDAGLRWFAALERAIASLREMPARCQLAPENTAFPFEVRQLFYGRKGNAYRILFTIEGATVYVLRIRHGRRKPLEAEVSG